MCTSFREARGRTCSLSHSSQKTSSSLQGRSMVLLFAWEKKEQGWENDIGREDKRVGWFISGFDSSLRVDCRWLRRSSLPRRLFMVLQCSNDLLPPFWQALTCVDLCWLVLTCVDQPPFNTYFLLPPIGSQCWYELISVDRRWPALTGVDQRWPALTSVDQRWPALTSVD